MAKWTPALRRAAGRQDARGDRLDQAAKTMEELCEIRRISGRRREIAGDASKATP
jgi:hypothetical protein